jgi:hypothetical protein
LFRDAPKKDFVAGRYGDRYAATFTAGITDRFAIKPVRRYALHIHPFPVRLPGAYIRRGEACCQEARRFLHCCRDILQGARFSAALIAADRATHCAGRANPPAEVKTLACREGFPPHSQTWGFLTGNSYNPQPHSLKFEAPNALSAHSSRRLVDAATIVRLVEETDGWVAICDHDGEVAPAAHYNAPGRLKDLQHLLPSSRRRPPAEEAACGSCDCALRGRSRRNARRYWGFIALFLVQGASFIGLSRARIDFTSEASRRRAHRL